MKHFPFLELFIILALTAIIGGFLLCHQYRLTVLVIVIFGAAIIFTLKMNYDDERAREMRHSLDILASLAQQQIEQIDKLMDRVQGLDPITNNRLHNPPTPPVKTPVTVMDFPTIDGVRVVEEFGGNEG